MKRHINEFAKTGFANSGRAAGHGMAEDNYGDESGPGNLIRQGRPIPRISEEEPDPPVITYFISKEEAEKL